MSPRHMTDEEIAEFEKMDDNVYESTKSTFEFLALRSIEIGRSQEDRQKDIAAVIKAYVSMADSCKRLSQEHRKVLNKLIKEK